MDSSIDWHLWKHLPEVELWQAVCLARNINPPEARSKLRARPGTMCILIIEDIFADDAQGGKLLLLLKENLFKQPEFFTPGTSVSYDSPANNCVRLTEFATWCAHIDYDIPPELAALAKNAPQAAQKAEPDPMEQSAPTAKMEAVTITLPAKDESGLSKRERQIRAIEAEVELSGYEKLKIQTGCKTALRKKCKEKFLLLFGAGNSPFDDAWKAASNSTPPRLRMADHNKFARK